MNLNEAKKILNDNGYKVELNEDLRKAWDEVKDSVSDALVGGMRKLSPKVQQFIQDTIPLGAALKEAGTIYGFRVEKEEGFYKLTVRNKHTSTAPDFLYVKGFRGNIEVNIDGEGWTTKTIKVHSKKELMDLLKIVLYSVEYEQPEAAAKGWFKLPQNESTITEAKQELIEHGYIIAEDTETNDDEIEDLTNEWRDKHNSRASDKELDDIFWKRNKVEKRHLDLEDKIAAAKQFNSNQSWTEDDVQEIRDAIYARFDPDFGGLNKWSVQTGNNGKNYVYFKDDEVCRVSYNKKEKSVNLNFGDGMGVDFEFDSDEETFEEFIKFILTRIKEQNYG